MMFYAIELLDDKKGREFIEFMRDEIFPAVDKGSLRNGQITGLVLLGGNNFGHSHEYLWISHGGVNGGAAEQQIDRIEAFGAKVTPMQDFLKYVEWFAEGEDSLQKIFG